MADLDTFLDELQNTLNEEAKADYGEDCFDRWRNPPHFGRPSATNGQGASTGNCGDTIWIFLHIEDDTVREAGFHTDGCASSQISGSMAAELALNKRSEDLTAITGEVIRDQLGSLPENDEHCAWLAANALHDAVGDYYKHTLRQTEQT